jgi:hypothetical protein
MRRGIILAVLVLGVLASCGEQSPGDKLRSDAAAELGNVNSDTACDGYSDRFIRRAYGSREVCSKNYAQRYQVPDGEDGQFDVDVKSAEIAGRRGRVDAEVDMFGTFKYQGHAQLVQEDGSWKIDGLEPDMMRSELGAQYSIVAEGIPLYKKPGVRDCLLDRIARLSPADLETYYFGNHLRTKAAVRREFGDLNVCVPTDSQGRSPTRQIFESLLIAAGKDAGFDERAVRCAVTRTRDLSEKQLDKLVPSDYGRIGSTQRAIQQILDSCSAGTA